MNTVQPNEDEIETKWECRVVNSFLEKLLRGETSRKRVRMVRNLVKGVSVAVTDL